MSQIKQEKFKYNYLERMKDMNDIYTDEKIREAKEFAFSLHANDRCIITNVPKSVHLKEVVDGIKTLNLHKNHIPAPKVHPSPRLIYQLLRFLLP